jgi:DNA helicase-2/ATP-dependent DNA helicase PcrA
VWPAQLPDQLSFVADLLGHHVETWWPRNEASPISNAAVDPLRQAGLTAALNDLQLSWQSYLLAVNRNLMDFNIIQQQFAEFQGDRILNEVDHVFVDEFQDTNPIQYLIHLQWVIPNPKRDPLLPKMRLTVVGDDDQSIYRFRGSDIACFMGLKGDCTTRGIPFREEVLPANNRSSREIVNFSSAYRSGAIPASCSLPKTISTPNPPNGPVRLVEGPWDACCELIASEATVRGYGTGGIPATTMALLLFSSSERVSRNYAYPATRLRSILEAKGISVDNSRNKVAGDPGSPVHTIAALLSYLIDPVERCVNSATGRMVFCWATSDHHAQATTKTPGFFVPPDYAALQREFFRDNCNQVGLGALSSDPKLQTLLDYLNKLRADLVAAVDLAKANEAKGLKATYPKLTLAGLVARLLSFPFFRDSGYTSALFRQSLLTEIVEAIVAPSRMAGDSLDAPLKAWTDGGQICWPSEIWSFIGALGQIVEKSSLDDTEVEAFAEGAFRVLTFHQSKGLEFDEVYVAGTGRPVSYGSVITTRAFSGQSSNYTVSGGVVSTTDPILQELAQADAAREVYVAITRAKKKLTILHDPRDTGGFMGLDPALENLFKDVVGNPHPSVPGLSIKEVAP